MTTGNEEAPGPLTAEEIKWLRSLKENYDHAKWAKRIGQRWFMYLAMAGGTLWAGYQWLYNHVSVRIGP